MDGQFAGPPKRRVLSDDEVEKRARSRGKRHHLRPSHESRQDRYEEYWQRMLARQVLAYAVVLALWVLPIPNPVKLLAVTFHEISHGIAAVATGGRVFGFAIAPNGAGVTLGMGGVYPVILLAGYVGSVLWGFLLYYLSVRWRPNQCLILLLVLVTGSAAFGWLNNYTAIFGIGSMLLMLGLFRAPSAAKVFAIHLVGSACCLYAPLEVVSKLLGVGSGIVVDGGRPLSDIDQLARLSHIPSPLVALAVLAIQSLVLVWVVHWTCRAGALRALQQAKAVSRWRRRLLRDIRFEDRIHKIG